MIIHEILLTPIVSGGFSFFVPTWSFKPLSKNKQMAGQNGYRDLQKGHCPYQNSFQQM